MVLKQNKFQYFNDPFPHAILDKPFSNANLLDKEFPYLEKFNTKSFRMNGDMTYPQENYLNLITKSKIYNNLHNYIYSNSFIFDFLQIFKKDIKKLFNNGELLFDPFKIPKISSPYETNIFEFDQNNLSQPFLYPRIDLGFGIKGYGSNNGGAGIHTDNWGRLISILYYVNQPNNMKGGSHRIYSLKDKRPILSKSFKPKKGLLIASLQTNYALHDVDPVTQINGSRNAFYIAISCNKKIWRKGEDWLMDLTSNRKNKKRKSLFNKFF